MHARRIQAVAALIAIGLLGGVSGCAGAAPAILSAAGVVDEAPTPTPTPPSTPVVVPYDDTFDPSEYGTGGPNDMALLSGAVVEGLVAVRDYAPQVYPELYTTVGSGTRGDPDVLRVYLTALDPAVEADLLAVAKLPAEKVLFLQSQHTEADANSLLAEITLRAETLEAEGVAMASWGMAIGGDVQVGIFGHDPAQIQTLWNEFGTGITIVVDTPASSIGYDSPACAADSIDPGFVGC